LIVLFPGSFVNGREEFLLVKLDLAGALNDQGLVVEDMNLSHITLV
jgi:hypothetical protein